MEVASAIQHGRRTSENKAAGSNSNARHQQPTRPKHSLAPMLLCLSNDINADLGEGTSMEVQTAPESSQLHQEEEVPVVPTVPDNGAISTVPVDDQITQQDPLLDTPLTTPATDSTGNSTAQAHSHVLSSTTGATFMFQSHEVSQTPRPQRWSWADARDKRKRERARNRIQLTQLGSVCSN